MIRYTIFALAAWSVLSGASILRLEWRLDAIEAKGVYCSRGIAVMMADGKTATTVCAP
jgi:hypothetical protein